MTTHIIGIGRLSWGSVERRSDRYGAVILMADGDSLAPVSAYITPDGAAVGQRGTIVAEVLEIRQSTHIGDLFRGLFPETPTVGDRIVLGTGTLFTEAAGFDGVTAVGLHPDVPRSSDWLDPKALYRAHEQTVRLVFEPDGGNDESVHECCCDE